MRVPPLKAKILRQVEQFAERNTSMLSRFGGWLKRWFGGDDALGGHSFCAYACAVLKVLCHHVNTL